MSAEPVSGNGWYQYESGALSTGERFAAPTPDSGLQLVLLEQMTGFSESANDIYVQLFDVVAPAPGGVPLISIKVPAGQTFSFTAPRSGFEGSNLLGWWVSTDPEVFATPAGTDECWVQASFRAVCTV